MAKQPLDESLERLNAELQKTKATDDESRRLLLDLQQDTHSAIRNPSPTSHASLRARLETTLTHFEDLHPQLTKTMQEVLDNLAAV